MDRQHERRASGKICHITGSPGMVHGGPLNLTLGHRPGFLGNLNFVNLEVIDYNTCIYIRASTALWQDTNTLSKLEQGSNFLIKRPHSIPPTLQCLPRPRRTIPHKVNLTYQKAKEKASKPALNSPNLETRANHTY